MIPPKFLVDLPQDLLKHILAFAADPVTFIACEQTCRTLKNILTDDTLWLTEDRGDDRLNTRREKACMIHALRSIRKEQVRATDNIIVSELGPLALKLFVESIGFQVRGNDHTKPLHCNMRGDTLFVLTEILQAHLIKFLETAMGYAIECARGTWTYPVLNRHMFRMAASTFFLNCDVFGRYNDSVGQQQQHSNVVVVDNEEFFFPTLIFTQMMKDKLVRRLSRRAGVPRMTNQVFDDVWYLLVALTKRIVRPAMEVADHFLSDENSHGPWQIVMAMLLADCQVAPPAVVQRRLLPTATEYTVSPFPRRVCPDCWDLLHMVTPVPQQIQDAASALGLPQSKVYGTGWVPIIREGMTKKEAIEYEIFMAKEEYKPVDEDDVSLADSDTLFEEAYME